jgi:sugar phosphate isomerase/epimerase
MGPKDGETLAEMVERLIKAGLTGTEIAEELLKTERDLNSVIKALRGAGFLAQIVELNTIVLAVSELRYDSEDRPKVTKINLANL